MRNHPIITFLAILAGSILGLGVPGCGKPSQKGITWAVGRDVTGAQAKLVEQYNRAHPDMPVRLLEMPESSTAQHDAYVTYLAGRDPSVDLYTLDVVWTAEFAEAGWVKAVDDRLPPDLVQDLLRGPLDSCRYKSKTWAVPWFTDSGLLYYRKDLLQKEGMKPPRTWTELTRQARLLRDKYHLQGYVFQGHPYEGLVCNYLEWLWGAGGSLEAGAAGIRLVSPQAVEALTAMRATIRKDGIAPAGVLTFKEEESRRAFTGGEAAFLRNWPYVWPLAQGEGSKVAGRVGIAALPGKSGPAPSVLGGWNLAISAYSRHPEAVWDFVMFLLAHDSQKEYALKGGRLPVRRSVYADPELKSAVPQFAALLLILEKARPRPALVDYAAVSDRLQVALHKVLSDQSGPQEALQEAERALAEMKKR